MADEDDEPLTLRLRDEEETLQLRVETLRLRVEEIKDQKETEVKEENKEIEEPGFKRKNTLSTNKKIRIHVEKSKRSMKKTAKSAEEVKQKFGSIFAIEDEKEEVDDTK
jgi:hypothetical protein